MSYPLAATLSRVEVASAPPPAPVRERFEPYSVGLPPTMIRALKSAAQDHGSKPVSFARWIIGEWLKSAGYLSDQ